MPRFDPHPARRPTLIAGASSGIGAATAAVLAARGFPVALGARRVDKCEVLAEQIRAGGGGGGRAAPRRHRTRLGAGVRRPCNCGTRGYRAPRRRGRRHLLRPAPRDRHRRLRVADPDPPDRRQPAGHRGTARHGAAPARRRRLRRLRCGTAPTPAHGWLRRRQDRIDRDGDQPADGVGRHRCPRVDRAPRPHPDVDGPEPAAGDHRPGAGGLGQVGTGAALLLPARGRSGPGHRVRRRDAPGRVRGVHGAYNRKLRYPTPRKNVSNSAIRRIHERAPPRGTAGLRRRGRTRPPRGVPHRSDRLDAPGSRGVRRCRLRSSWPTRR